MTSKEPTYDVSVKFPLDMKERVQALAKHQGVSVNAAINASVRDAVLSLENDDTTRERVKRIERKVDMMLLLAWRGMACDGKVEITADDVRSLRDLLAEIPL